MTRRDVITVPCQSRLRQIVECILFYVFVAHVFDFSMRTSSRPLNDSQAVFANASRASARTRTAPRAYIPKLRLDRRAFLGRSQHQMARGGPRDGARRNATNGSVRKHAPDTTRTSDARCKRS
jgi:hypothetical protein